MFNIKLPFLLTMSASISTTLTAVRYNDVAQKQRGHHATLLCKCRSATRKDRMPSALPRFDVIDHRLALHFIEGALRSYGFVVAM